MTAVGASRTNRSSGDTNTVLISRSENDTPKAMLRQQYREEPNFSFESFEISLRSKTKSGLRANDRRHRNALSTPNPWGTFRSCYRTASDSSVNRTRSRRRESSPSVPRSERGASRQFVLEGGTKPYRCKKQPPPLQKTAGRRCKKQPGQTKRPPRTID